MILELHDVAVRYITGDFKEIGIKEYVMRKLKHNYTVRELTLIHILMCIRDSYMVWWI